MSGRDFYDIKIHSVGLGGIPPESWLEITLDTRHQSTNPGFIATYFYYEKKSIVEKFVRKFRGFINNF